MPNQFLRPVEEVAWRQCAFCGVTTIVQLLSLLISWLGSIGYPAERFTDVLLLLN
jgi:hypothetical protein